MSNKVKTNLLALVFFCLGISLLMGMKASAETKSDLVAGAQLDGSFCLCPNCGEKYAHKINLPCRSVYCSRCKSRMMRMDDRDSRNRNVPYRAVNNPQAKVAVTKNLRTTSNPNKNENYVVDTGRPYMSPRYERRHEYRRSRRCH